MEIEDFIAALIDKDLEFRRAPGGFYVADDVAYEIWPSATRGSVDVVKWCDKTRVHEIVVTCSTITDIRRAMNIIPHLD
jgi:hypothetical protein